MNSLFKVGDTVQINDGQLGVIEEIDHTYSRLPIKVKFLTGYYRYMNERELEKICPIISVKDTFPSNHMNFNSIEDYNTSVAISPPISLISKENSTMSRNNTPNLKILKQYARYDGVLEEITKPTRLGKHFYDTGDRRVISRGIPMGVFLASYNSADDCIYVGYSLCHSTKDKFDKEKGTGIAFNRMFSGKPIKMVDVPHTIREQLRAFAVRATKYYQTINVVVCGG